MRADLRLTRASRRASAISSREERTPAPPVAGRKARAELGALACLRTSHQQAARADAVRGAERRAAL